MAVYCTSFWSGCALARLLIAADRLGWSANCKLQTGACLALSLAIPETSISIPYHPRCSRPAHGLPCPPVTHPPLSIPHFPAAPRQLLRQRHQRPLHRYHDKRGALQGRAARGGRRGGGRGRAGGGRSGWARRGDEGDQQRHHHPGGSMGCMGCPKRTEGACVACGAGWVIGVDAGGRRAGRAQAACRAGG